MISPHFLKNLILLIKNDDLQNTNWSSKHVLSLPVHPGVTEMDVQNMADTLKRELQKIL